MAGEEGNLSAIGQLVFGKAPPPPAHLVGFAKQQVDHAQLRFKTFRQDFERINNAASGAWRDGQITKDEAAQIFYDAGHMISAPLVQRYLHARECEKIANWLRARPEFHFPDWLNPRNRMALDGFVAHGGGALAVALIRQHLNKTMGRARKYWQGAGRKEPANLNEEQSIQFRKNRDAVLAKLPGELELAVMELAELEPWIIASGSHEDKKAIAAMRDELAKVRGRFNLA